MLANIDDLRDDDFAVYRIVVESLAARTEIRARKGLISQRKMPSKMAYPQCSIDGINQTNVILICGRIDLLNSDSDMASELVGSDYAKLKPTQISPLRILFASRPFTCRERPNR